MIFSLAKENSEKIFLIILLSFSSLIFFNTSGTIDVSIWLSWIKNVETHGIIKGYAIDRSVQPPFGSLIFFLFSSIASSPLMGIKLSMYFFLFLSVIIIYFVTRNFWIAILLYVFFILNSVALQYHDIYYTPFLILSFHFINKNNCKMAILFFSIASLIKMQVFILFPFVVIHLIQIDSIYNVTLIKIKKILFNVIIPIILIHSFIFVVYGMPYIKSFKRAFGNTPLSGQGMNIGWVITYIIELVSPEKIAGQNLILATVIWDKTIFHTILKISFAILYLVLLIKYFYMKEKKFEVFLLFLYGAFLTYFVINKGVHENHMHILVLISLFLYYLDKNNLIILIITGLFYNINLFIFYGYDGNGIPQQIRMLLNFDITIGFSFFIIIYYIFFIYKLFIYSEDPSNKLIMTRLNKDVSE